MTTLFYLIAYAAVIGFVFLVVTKVRAYMNSTPLHIRWEVYPVPHEGKKAVYGGSMMEKKEWWNAIPKPDHMGDLIALLKEVLFLEATFKHNKSLWVRSYPFHLGMYAMMGGIIILFFVSVLEILGVSPKNGFIVFLGNVINAVAMLGLLGILGGGLTLIYRRISDKGLSVYSAREQYFNLAAFVVYAVFGLAAWATSTEKTFFELSSTFMVNMFTFNFQPLTSSPFGIHLFIGFFLMIWIPLTNMSHLIYKYFTYHDIRWGDTPTIGSEKNQKRILDCLKLKPTWSAEHIAGDGNKTWVDIATSNPADSK